MKLNPNDHLAVVFTLANNEEVEIAHVELSGEDVNYAPLKPAQQINRALATYLKVHAKRHASNRSR